MCPTGMELGVALRIGPKIKPQISIFSPFNPTSTQNYENLFSNSFQKSQVPVIYIVEGHEKARGLKEGIPYISKMAIGNAGMKFRNSKRVPPFSPLPSPEK